MVMRTRSGILGQTIGVKPIAETGMPFTLVLPRILGNGDGRVGTARELPEVLRGLGFDPDYMIASTGIDPRTLDDSDTTLPSATLGSLLEACVAQTGCPYVGLLVGARARTSCFGLVGLLMQHAPTVAAALQCLIDHGHHYYPGVVTTLEVRDGTAVLRYALSPADADGAVQIVDSALAAGFRILRGLCGDDWLPSEVLLSHPAHGSELAYRQVFRFR